MGACAELGERMPSRIMDMPVDDDAQAQTCGRVATRVAITNVMVITRISSLIVFR